MINIFDLLAVMAIGWAVFGLVRVLMDPFRSAGVGWPAAVLILSCLIPLVDEVFRRFVFGGPLPPPLRALDRGVGYLIGPFLLLYTSFLLARRPPRSWSNLLHLLPFALSMVLAAVPSLHLLSIPPAVHAQTGFLGPPHTESVSLGAAPGHPIAPALENLGKFISVEVYGFLVLVRIHRRGLEAGDYYSDRSGQVSVRWLHHSVFSYLLLFAVATAALTYIVVTHSGDAEKVTVINLSPLVVFSFLFILFSRNQHVPKEVWEDRVELARAALPVPVDASALDVESEASKSEEPTKYLRSGLDDREIEEMFMTLTDFVVSRKVYLDPQISLADLSEKLGASRHHISQVINTKSSGNFYNFINQFRVEEFVRMIQKGEHKTKTLVAIASDCGFNSYPTFYNTFKRVTGSTPRAFLASHGVGQPA